MSERFPGGFITKAPVAPTSGAASGIWTLDQAMQYIKAGTWPFPQWDPYFYSNVTLLQNGATNNGTNSTFLDSSTNALTVTKNGNVSQGTFSPFSQTGWSNYFSSSWETATAPNLSGTWTVECWWYPENVTSQQTIISFNNGANTGINIWCNSSGQLVVDDGANAQTAFSATKFTANTWQHVAIVRNGTTTTGYINGVVAGSNTFTPQTTSSVSIGRYNQSPFYYVTGFISNVRVVNGTAVYTAAFTPPTAPLTAISGTALLTCQSNRFLDNSSNAYTITPNGTPSVFGFSPFNPTTAWSASVNGGSAFANAVSTYLSVASNSQTAPQSSNFTIEAWVYFVNGAANQVQPIYTNYTTFTNAGSIYFGKHTNNSGAVTVWFSNYSTGGPLLAEATLPPSNSWTHYALVRNGNTFTLYRNGVSTASATWSGAATGSTNANWIMAAGDSTGTYSMQGYISNFRIVNGSAVYTTAFTPPTAPLTAITNTALLLNCTNSSVVDYAADVDLITAGNAKTSNAVVKYSPTSVSFDGTNSYLYQWQTTNLYNFGTGDFTIEGWVYPLTQGGHGSGNNDCLFEFRPGSNGAYPTIYLYSSGAGVYYFFNSANQIAGFRIENNGWYHIAVCRVASVTKLFINGVQAAAALADTTNYLAAPLMIGQFNDGSGAGWFNGYMDNIRITKGVGRYPYTFAPATQAFPITSGGTPPTATADPYFRYTTLLLPGNGTNGAQNNTFLDSSSNAFTITRNGNTTQGNFSPFSQTGWGVNFPGSGNYLTIADGTQFDLSGGSYTIECWIYPTGDYGNYNTIIAKRGGACAWEIYLRTSTGVLSFFNGTNYESTVTPSANQWHHVAAVYDGTNINLYLDGTRVYKSAITNSNTAASIYIGTFPTYDERFIGYISNMRITKGAALYTGTSFTVPTTALTTSVSAGTVSLLTCQSNRFRDASTNNAAITVTGSPSIQAFSPFAPTAAYSASTVGGSGYFDGSGDYLTAPTNAAFNIGTGDYTFEAWIYKTTSARAMLFAIGSGGLSVAINASGNIEVCRAGVAIDFTFTAGITNNTWAYVTVSRSGTSLRAFLNGALLGTQTSSTSYAQGICYVGIDTGGTGDIFAGYMTDFRLVKGTAVYTAAFTPPTAPLTAISGTSLLLSATNGGIVDATAKNDLETVGNAQISTTQSKFGGSSMYFDGTGDWLTPPASQNLTFGTSDFTIEMWVYAGNQSGTAVRMMGNGAGAGWGAGKWIMTTYSTAGYVYQFNWWNYSSGTTGALIGTSASNTSTWNHVAVTRYGNTWKLFVNGIAEATVTSSTSLDGGTAVPIRIGSGGISGDADWAGYIDDLRITKGIARYTSNFTPPTSAFLTQ